VREHALAEHALLPLVRALDASTTPSGTSTLSAVKT